MDSPRVVILGAPPDTWNLGVDALLTSTVAALLDTLCGGTVPGCSALDIGITVFDNGFGVRDGALEIGSDTVDVQLVGARQSKRLHRRDSLATIAICGVMPGLDTPAAAAIRGADVVFDISGGDSFSDIYGWGSYSQMILQKRIVLRQGRPLVLLPQTYGPYGSAAARRLAASTVRRATLATARDPWSFRQLRDLLGEHFDPTRHRTSVDLAFALPSLSPRLDDELEDWLTDGSPIAGMNVNGMLYLDEDSGQRFGLAADHRTAVSTAARAILSRTDAKLLLVPHGVAPPGHPQSDPEACADLHETLADWGPRVMVAPALRRSTQAKGLISRTDWFCGARMHATIASLSSAVPTAAIAYSDKAAGVFATSGMDDQVIELRDCGAEQMAERLVWSYEGRDRIRPALIDRLPELRARARAPITDALAHVGIAVPTSGGPTA